MSNYQRIELFYALLLNEHSKELFDRTNQSNSVSNNKLNNMIFYISIYDIS